MEAVLQTEKTSLVELKNVSKVFSTSSGPLVACAEVDIAIRPGTSFGLVGESGSGKSTLVRVMQRLIQPTTGRIYMNGVDVTHMSARKMKPFRRHVQAVAQDPYGSLFPHYTVGQNIAEPLAIHAVLSGKGQQEKTLQLMHQVGLSSDYYYSFPHELSGGQQQRVAIARALALDPALLVLDEAVASLDVSIQAQILNLLQTMKEQMGLTYAFVSHNLAVVRLLCEETAVMYLGRVVEAGPSDELFKHPRHPYTRALLDSIPAFTQTGVKPLPALSHMGKERPSATNLPSGCAYHNRCPFATNLCKEVTPPLQALESGHRVACHHADAL